MSVLRDARSTEIIPANFPRNHIVEFGGLPVLEFTSSTATAHLRSAAAADLINPPPSFEAAVAAPGSVAWWLEFEREKPCAAESFEAYLDRFAASVRTSAITALVVGGTTDVGTETRDAVKRLIARRADFANLRSLFVGEIDDDQITFADRTDVGPLLAAYPDLTEFVVCVSSGLEFGVADHAALQRLVIYSAALSPEVIEAVAECELPRLRHLELWDGDSPASTRDRRESLAFDALTRSEALPQLRHLGLRGFTFADQMVAQLADSTLLSRLTSLDLSDSNLTDIGGRMLLELAVFRSLDSIGLRRHAMSPRMVEALCEKFSGLGVDVHLWH